MITTNIVFDHRGRTKTGDEGPLEVRVTIDRKNYYVNTGVKVRRSEWRMGIIINRADSDTLMKRLSIIYKRIEEEINAAVAAGEAIDVAEIRKRAWAAKEDASSTALIEWIVEQIYALPHNDGTKVHYMTLLKRLREFDGIRRWQDLTVENITRFDTWLHSLKKKQSKADILAGIPAEPIGDGAVYNYHKCFKALLNRAVKFDRLDRNPYDRLRGEFKRGDANTKVDFLTDEEMEAFIALHPIAGSKMAMARDLFVFQLFTGLAYSDTQQFDIKDYKMIDGKWVNTGERIKTGVAYVSHLLPPVVEILERYNWQVPKLDNSDYNLCLKALGMACGIERPLHSHMARHTFATFMLRNGVPIEHVSKMLGHTNITQTQRYAKLVAKDIHKDFERIAGLIADRKLTEK